VAEHPRVGRCVLTQGATKARHDPVETTLRLALLVRVVDITSPVIPVAVTNVNSAAVMKASVIETSCPRSESLYPFRMRVSPVDCSVRGGS